MARAIKITQEMRRIDCVSSGWYAIDPLAMYRASIKTNAYHCTLEKNALRHKSLYQKDVVYRLDDFTGETIIVKKV